MTYKIKATTLAQHGLTAERYGEIVRYHAGELANWDAHMKRVEASLHLPKSIPDPAQEPPVPGKEHEHVQRFVHNPAKHTPYPPPAAPAMIDEAVRRGDFAPDYEVEDDLPPPPSAEEVLAGRKRALIDAVSIAEAAAAAALIAPGKRRLADLQFAAAFEKPEEKRSIDEVATIGASMLRMKQLHAIELHAAQMMHDIEDLTAATVDAWSMTPFPEQSA